MRLGTMMGRERMDNSAGMVLRGMRLNPNHPRYFYFSLAQVLFNQARFEEALTAIKKTGANDDNQWQFYWLAVINAELGNVEEAEAARIRFLELYPDFSSKGAMKDFVIHESFWDLYHGAAEKAGLPIEEGDASALVQ